MLSHEEMIGLQAEKHDLIDDRQFPSQEAFVLHLMHSAAYDYIKPLVTGKAVLDLGCNTGYGSHTLSGSASRIVGVDVSSGAISTAKERYPEQEFLQTDGQKLPFEENSFDTTVSCQVIEHIVDYQRYISEIKRVLKPTGVVHFTTPNSRLRLDPGMKPWNEFHVREFDFETLEELLRKYFKHVAVFGLFATEPLYSIEVAREKRGLEDARLEASRSYAYKLGRVGIRKLVPKAIRQAFSGKPNPPAPLDDEFRQKHSTADFFYQTTEREKAIDLMAVCSDDSEALERVSRSLTVAR